MRALSRALSLALALGAAAPARAQTRVPHPPRFFATVAAAGQLTANQTTEDLTFTVYVEDGTIHGVARAPRGVRVEAGGGLWITPRIAVGATLSAYRANGPLDVTATVPNPFFFDQPRTATASTTVHRSTVDVHADVIVRLLESGRWTVLAGGGPSFTRVSQQVGTDLTLDDVYPFDTVSIRSIALSTLHGTGVGGNVSASAVWRLDRRFRLVGTLRWSSTTATLTTGHTSIDAPTGGVQIAGGLRVVF
jgi:hypothetical protein